MTERKPIHSYFNKYFEFTDNENWYLPTQAYRSPPWQVDTLQELKATLNKVKSQLSSFDLETWSEHTKFREPSSHVVQTLRTKGNMELVTQAWCKFYECLNQFDVVPQIAISQQSLVSLHLCEAPGAFVCALNRFLYTNFRNIAWQWRATTLNPYYEGNPPSDMIADDRLIRHTLQNWEFGLDQSGNIMKFYNHEALISTDPVMLVTADGSVDCMNDPGEQESIVHFLHYCETITALKVLEQWGTFVLKLFTMFEYSTICLMYLLNCCFVKVSVFKPCTSKSGNSEVYVICVGYKGRYLLENMWSMFDEHYKNNDNAAMFARLEINRNFLKQLEDCAKCFMNEQIFTINQNVKYFNGERQDEDEIDNFKMKIAKYYLMNYTISLHAPKRCKMLGNNKKTKQQLQQNWTYEETCVSYEPVVLTVTIGGAITVVTKSSYCQTKFDASLFAFQNDHILEAAKTLLPPSYMKIEMINLETRPQYTYQREFFQVLVDNFQNGTNIVIVAIPLLTKFLVGLIYILALGFESVGVFHKGIIILRNVNFKRLRVVSEYFTTIENAYRDIKGEQRFDADILEVVPEKYLTEGFFYEAICHYNNGLFKSVSD